MAVTWVYDGGTTLVATIDDAVIGDSYMLRCEDDSSTADIHLTVVSTTVVFTVSTISNTPLRSFAVEIFHGAGAGISTNDDVVYANVFDEGTASTTGMAYDATWSYDGVDTTSVTITAVAGVTYYMWGRPAVGVEFSGGFGPFAGGSTQTLTWTHSSPTTGKRFQIILGDNDSLADYSDRIFQEGVASVGDPGNPTSAGGGPTVTSISPSSGCSGDPIVITGSGFTGTTDVDFNSGQAAAFTVDSDTQITATVPNGATTGPIIVTTPGGSDASGTFTVTAGPTNDDYPPDFTAFFDRAVYYLGSNLGGCLAATTKCATFEAGEPDPAAATPASHSVWFTFEPVGSATFRFWLTSVDPDMADGVMSIYDYVTGAPSGLAAAISQCDDELGTQPECTVALTGGNDYAIQIDTRNLGGTFTLHWVVVTAAPPTNDDFADAEALGGNCGDLLVTLTDATPQCGEPTGADDPDGPYNTVWYAWTPTYSGKGTVSIHGVTAGFHDLDLDVFTGATLTGLSSVLSHEFSGTPPPGLASPYQTFDITAGTTYYIRWQGRGEPLTFTMQYETDENAWKARAGAFAAGQTTVETGLGELPTALILYASGEAEGTYQSGIRLGIGASDGTDQWACSFAHPYLSSATNGVQYGQTTFVGGSIIRVLDVDGSVYAEASVVSFNSDGTITLAWATDPGDGYQVGFLATSGDVEAKVGTLTMDPALEVATVITPGFRVRALVTAGAAVTDPDGFGNFLSGIGSTFWTESGPGGPVGGTGISAQIAWYFTGDDEGIFQTGGGYPEAGVTAASLPRLGADSLTVTTPVGNGTVGWIALGGCGWHANEGVFNGATESFPTDFWTQAGLAYGFDDPFFSAPPGMLQPAGNAAVSMLGGFDQNDSQFDFTVFALDYDGSHTSVHTPATRNCWNDRIWSVPADFTTEQWHAVVDLPGQGIVGGDINYTITPPNPAEGAPFMLLLGNWLPPLVGPIFVPQIVRYK